VDYDTSVKIFRKIYPDCQVSYEGSRYILPRQVVDKRVLLKVKEGTVRFFEDDPCCAPTRKLRGLTISSATRSFTSSFNETESSFGASTVAARARPPGGCPPAPCSPR
jgi:hypothetical protein